MQMQALAPGQICTNGRFYTLDVHNTIAQSFAVKGSHFLTIGCTLETEAMAGDRTERIDLLTCKWPSKHRPPRSKGTLFTDMVSGQ